MKLFAASLTRNGSAESNSFVSNINPDPVTNEFRIYPVEIPTTGGSWFEDVTTAEVDNAGYLVWAGSTFNKYMNASAIPDYKYGYDPMWNVEDTGTYQFIDKVTGETVTIEGGYLGNPKLQDAPEVLTAKLDCKLQTRMLLVYNDSPNTLNNVKVRIDDQTLRGTVVELTDGTGGEWGYYQLIDGNYTVEKDGADYSPANAKIVLTSTGGLGNSTETDYIPQEITIPFLDAAGTEGAWFLGYLTMYVTKENGNYAGTENDYITIATQTVA